MHLTDAEATDPGLTPGSVPATFEHGEIRFGFAACFDLYFPEHFAALAAQAVDVVLCTSYQRSESADRIRGIAQVRALDTGAYPLRGSYAMGQPDTGAHSPLVAAADGAVLNNAGAGACLLAAELDPKRKFTKPVSHGRPEVEHRALIESHRRAGVYCPRLPFRNRRFARVNRSFRAV